MNALQKIGLLFTLPLSCYTCNSEEFSPASVSVSIDVSADKTLEAMTGLLREIKNNKGAIVENSISGCVQQIKAETKLVVATVEIAATSYRYFENKDIAGFTVVGYHLIVVSSPENNVQFYIPLDGIKPRNLTIDDKNFSIRMAVPRPVMDKKMIGIARDKIVTKWLKSGIAPYSDASVMHVVDQIKSTDLPEEIKRQAESNAIRQSVEDAGKRAVEQLLRKFLMNDRLFGKMPWLKIEVVYDSNL